MFKCDDVLDGVAGRIYSDDCVSAPEQQPIKSREQYAGNVIGWMIRLHSNSEDSAFTHCVSAASDGTQRRRRGNEVACAHDPGDASDHLRSERVLQPSLPLGSKGGGEHEFTKFAHSDRTKRGERFMIKRRNNQIGHVVFNQWLLEECKKRNIGQRHLGRHPFSFRTRCDSREPIACLWFVCTRHEIAKISKSEGFAAQRDRPFHALTRSSGTTCSVNSVANRAGSPPTQLRQSGKPST